MKKLVLIAFLFYSINVLPGGFDDLGNSARAISLGGAFTSISDAPYALFYNSASIFRINNLSLSTTYTNLFPGIQDDNLNYFSLSGVIPLNIVGQFGIGGTFLNSNLWQEQTFVATYAREIYGNFAVGGSFKFLHWSAEAAPGEESMSYSGFTFDVGVLYSLLNVLNDSEINLGLAIQNFTEPSIAKNGSESAKLPMKIAFGVSFYSTIYKYLITADIVKERDILSLKSGVEFSTIKTEVFGVSTEFLIRMGYNRIISSDFSEESALNGGFGLNVDKLKIDYAYAFPIQLIQAGSNHKISLSYNF